MLPVLTVPDKGNHGAAYAKSDRDICLSPSRTSYSWDITLRQFGTSYSFTARMQAKLYRVLHVGIVRNVLQVTRNITGLHAILMIYLKAWRAWADECRCNEQMYERLRSVSSVPQADLEISIPQKPGPKNVTSPCALATQVSPDLPKTRNRVGALVADHWPPLFGKMRMHRKVLLSLLCSRAAPTVAAASIVASGGA